MRGWLVAATAIAVFAGCVSEGQSASVSPSESAGPSTSASVAPPTESSAPAPPNAAPAISMEVDNASGAAPLNVTFTLNGTDPDGDALTWTLAFGDGSENETGSLLPAIFTHAFELEGNFTVVFEASDGNHTVNATAPVTVNAAVGAAKQTKIITGTTVLPNPAGDCCVCINDDVDGNRYALDPAEAGWLYTLEPGDGSFGVYWYNGGSYVSSSDPEGEVPEGVDVVEVCNLTGLPDTDYTMTLTEP